MLNGKTDKIINSPGHCFREGFLHTTSSRSRLTGPENERFTKTRYTTLVRRNAFTRTYRSSRGNRFCYKIAYLVFLLINCVILIEFRVCAARRALSGGPRVGPAFRVFVRSGNKLRLQRADGRKLTVPISCWGPFVFFLSVFLRHFQHGKETQRTRTAK